MMTILDMRRNKKGTGYFSNLSLALAANVIPIERNRKSSLSPFLPVAPGLFLHAPSENVRAGAK